MQLINELPKYSFDPLSRNIIFYKGINNHNYPYWYFSPLDCEERAWGTLRDYQAYSATNIPIISLELKHLFAIKEPIEGQKREFVIAFIKDLIEEITAK
jgi:hypothetical protein